MRASEYDQIHYPTVDWNTLDWGVWGTDDRERFGKIHLISKKRDETVCGKKLWGAKPLCFNPDEKGMTDQKCASCRTWLSRRFFHH